RPPSNPPDPASNSRGVSRADNGGTVSYSRNGQFHVDKDGFLVNATSGKLTGYGVDQAGAVVVGNPVSLQLSNSQLKANVTSKAEVGTNLDSREPIIAVPFNITNSATYNKATSMTVYDTLGNSHSLATY